MDILIEEMSGGLWVAALENGRLEGLEVDPAHEDVRWGSIYWGRVSGFNTAMDAAYIDLDGERTGLLYNKDVRLPGPDGAMIKGGAAAIGKTLRAGQMVAVQAKSGVLMRRDEDDLPLEDKQPVLSMDITLPGRYLIYGPMIANNQVSQRIRDKALRKRLHKMLDALDDIRGCILRASAAHTQTDMLMREGKILKEVWEQIKPHFTGDQPALIMAGPDAIQRTLSDQAARIIDTIEIVIMDHFTLVEDWASVFAPDLVTKIKPISLKNARKDFALFEHRDITGQIEDLFKSYVLLPSGGNIIVQGTAALCAVDVNRGADKRPPLAINIEAVQEAARQIRLRNIGGIVMIDCLKMGNKRDEGRLIAAMEEAVMQDSCTVQIHGMTALGLLEITRKRRTPPLEERMGDLS